LKGAKGLFRREEEEGGRMGIAKGIHGRVSVKRDSPREKHDNPGRQAFKDRLEEASLPIQGPIGPGQVLGELGNAPLQCGIRGNERLRGRLEGEESLPEDLLPLF
jgi:hypothetical protein